jgi:DNA-binding CsgD family transcriptional regulator/Flp pilus assembly protein TadD
MTLSLDKPTVCPIVIGRDDEITVLQRALDQVHGGRGQTILIAGEAGVGKSRLIAAVRTHAEGLRFLYLQGRCFEQDAALPYAPLADLLRLRLADLPPEASAPNALVATPELALLVPELAMDVPGVTLSAPLEPEQEKKRLFGALSRFILGQPSARPVLVVIEDLHWCDGISLEFLLSLARHTAAHRLLLVLSYRSEEIGRGLRHLLAELDRARLAQEIVLKPLTRVGVGMMLRATLGLARPAHAEFVDALYALTEGNPFFVEEVIKSLADTGAFSGDEGVGVRQHLEHLRVPRSVQDAVLRRLDRISAPAQRVLTLAAVAGPRFDFSLLQAIAGQHEAELLQHIKELVAAQFVVEESAERFAFRHALTRQAIYGQLLVRERQALHRTTVEAIEQLHEGSADAHLPDLAYHAFAAGLWEKALVYARRMGERALAMNAPQAAIEQFTRAIEAARRLGQPPAPELLRARGQAYETRGEFERAQDDYIQVLDAARAVGNRGAEWQGLLDLGFLWLARDYSRAGDYLRQARDLADQMEDPARLAQSLNRLGNWYANMDQPRQAQGLHRQALAIFRDLNDQPGIAQTLDLLAVTTFFAGDRQGAITAFEEAATCYRALGDRRGLVSTLATLGPLRCCSRVVETLPAVAPRARQAVGECEEALTIAREIGWRSGEAYALLELAACLLAAGDYGRAQIALNEGLAIAEEIEHRGWLTLTHSGLGKMYLDLLALRAARWHYERAYSSAQETGAKHLIESTAAFLAEASLLGHMPVRAEAVLQDLVAEESSVETLKQSALLTAYGELRLVRGDADQALRAADRVIAWAEQAGEAGVIPRLWKLRGESLAALGRTAEAEAALRAAREAAREQGSRPLLWQLHASLGALLHAQGRREDAEQAYAAARLVVEQMAATIPNDALREEFLGSALARIPTARQPSARGLAKDRYGGLTAREREVVALIARGLSNREIAEALVISERTVEAHTGHIRDKLGHTSRTQVAAWAVEHGLAQDEAR